MNSEMGEEGEAREWKGTFDKFFAEMGGRWAEVFPPRGAWGDDVYVWQFLASVAVGAGMEQQHVLVTECRYAHPSPSKSPFPTARKPVFSPLPSLLYLRFWTDFL